MDCIDVGDVVNVWTKYHERPIAKTIARKSVFERKFSFLNEMRKSKTMCDAILITGDGTKIPAHKCVLYVGSKYFFILFSKYTDKNCDSVNLANIDAVTLKETIEYLYTNEITLPTDRIESLLYAADFLEIQDLKEKICQFLLSHLNESNCFEIRTLFEQFSCGEYLDKCERHMIKHFHKIMDEDQFYELPVEILIRFISSDEISVPYEESIYKCILKWIKKDTDYRRWHLPQMMSKVRFHFMDRQFLFDVWSGEPLLLCFDECAKMVSEAYAKLSHEDDIPNEKFRDWSPAKVIFSVGGAIHDGAANKQIDCFFPFRKTWYSMPCSLIPSSLLGAGIVYVEGKIYFIGGVREDSGVVSKSVYAYCVKSEQVLSRPVPELNERRAYASVVCVGLVIYVAGGQNSTEDDANTTYHNTIVAHGTYSAWWSPCSTMTIGRSGACAVVWNHSIYIIGGYSFREGHLKSVECYNPHRGRWSSVLPMNYSRRGAGAAVLNDIIFVAGGYIDKDTVTNSVEMYDLVAGCWTTIAPMDIPRAFGGLSTDEENEFLYYFGGRCCFHDSIEQYSFKTKEWIRLPQYMNLPSVSYGIIMGEKVFYK